MPQVSIVVPCYNEQATIRFLLEAILSQTYDLAEMEVIIADGMSSDGTRDEIAGFQSQHPNLSLKVVDNLKRNIPSGLNRAIKVASGNFIIRLDAHSVPAEDYIARCVQALENETAENVGGIWEIRPGGRGWISQSIALAAAHPLGVGDAHYRVGGNPQWVDTVPFGAFRKDLVDNLGPFDETLLSNEDYEFNARIRKSGGRIWLDPQIQSVYFARPDFHALAIQYWRYGYWKVRMLVRYPETFRWRQLAGVFVLTWVVLILLSIPFPLARWLLLVEGVVYVAALSISGAKVAFEQGDIKLLLGVPIAIATMHFSWGSAFLWSALEMGWGSLVGRLKSTSG